jgi:hypothetical protein
MKQTRLGIQGRRAGQRKSYFCGEILPHVFPGRHQLGALFNECVRSPGILVGDVARHGKDVAILLECEACGDARAEYSAASTTSTPTDMPLRMRLRSESFATQRKSLAEIRK